VLRYWVLSYAWPGRVVGIIACFPATISNVLLTLLACTPLCPGSLVQEPCRAWQQHASPRFAHLLDHVRASAHQLSLMPTLRTAAGHSTAVRAQASGRIAA
jgi:hypothetical protein